MEYSQKPLTAAASGSEGAPAWSFALRRGLRSHEVCTNVLAQMLSRSLRETSGSTDLTNSHSQGFMHQARALKLVPRACLNLTQGSQAEVLSPTGPGKPLKGVKPKPRGGCRCLDLSVSPAFGTAVMDVQMQL